MTLTYWRGGEYDYPDFTAISKNQKYALAPGISIVTEYKADPCFQNADTVGGYQ